MPVQLIAISFEMSLPIDLDGRLSSGQIQIESPSETTAPIKLIQKTSHLLFASMASDRFTIATE